MPAAVAIALVGIAALAIAIASDLPDVGDTGSIGTRLEDAEIGTGLGAYAETLGGVLLLAAGGMLAFAQTPRLEHPVVVARRSPGTG